MAFARGLRLYHSKQYTWSSTVMHGRIQSQVNSKVELNNTWQVSILFESAWAQQAYNSNGPLLHSSCCSGNLVHCNGWSRGASSNHSKRMRPHDWWPWSSNSFHSNEHNVLASIQAQFWPAWYLWLSIKTLCLRLLECSSAKATNSY